ncbi:hypothetical protein K2173_012408 [Erythroxylum novogranatense]|uniref:PROP1-like PPR domain-containing protein n=1 Tax=Erythroxylum novogranatense TaxID=1862640 RepID=A0AAV8S500_9ROSI|nr:hypothetical protein K2173_012408 [Erythroxylum novogranatense]
MSIRWPRILTPTQLSLIIRNQKNPLTALQIFKEVKDKYPNYCHNGPVYAAMVGILANSGRILEMKEVIDQMREDSCECKDSVFVTAIKTYAQAGRLDEAVTLFSTIPQFNCVNWTESFNTLLHIMVKNSKFEAAYRLFLDNSYGWEVKSRIHSLNLLMSALCQQNRSDLALHIFLEMNYQGCYPSRDSYRILMEGLCVDGRLNEAIHLLYSMFWRISQKGSGEDVAIYRILLDALCDNGQVDVALDILNKILRKGLKVHKRYHCSLDLCECQDIEATKEKINDALIRGGVPNLKSYTAMAADLYQEGKVDQANKVLHETRGRGFRPSLLTYEAKLAALSQEGRVAEAVNVIEVEMVEANCVPTVRLYNILLKGLCNAGNSVLAVQYLKKMAKQVGCVADQETYDVLVNGLCRDGRFVEASRLLDEMLIRSYRPGVDIYSMVMRGLCFMGRQYEVVMWLEEMISQGMLPQLSVWNSLVSSFCCKMTDINLYSERLKQLTNDS